MTLFGGRSRQPAAEVPSILSTILPIIGVVLVAYLAPTGAALYAGHGFAAIALAATLIPLVTLFLIAPLRAAAPPPAARPSFTKVVGAVWMPGFGLAISGVGFGAITTFIVLLFAQHGWGQAWLALTFLLHC